MHAVSYLEISEAERFPIFDDGPRQAEGQTRMTGLPIDGIDKISTLVDDLIASHGDCWHQALLEIGALLRSVCSDVLRNQDQDRLVVHPGRIKQRERIIGKLLNGARGAEFTMPSSPAQILSTIHDIVGLRIACKTPRDLRLIHGRLMERLNAGGLRIVRVRDYTTAPKPSGYRGLHIYVTTDVQGIEDRTSVEVEVQLRTRLQDAWGELTHEDLYKPGALKPLEIHSRIARAMAGLLAEVDSLADDLAQDLDKQVSPSRQGVSNVASEAGSVVPAHESFEAIIIAVNPTFAIATSATGARGIIPFEPEYFGSGRPSEGDRVRVRSVSTASGEFFLPTESL